jgi:protein subunit release factor A
MSMSREQIFNDLKDLVLTLCRHPNLQANQELFKKWQEKSRQVQDGEVLLSIHDRSWLSKEYENWHKNCNELNEHIKKYKNTLTPKK